MKRTTFMLALSLAACSMFIVSCKKTDDPSPSNTQPNPQTPVVGNVDGALVSLKLNYTYSYPGIPSIPVTAQIGLATMFNNGSNSNLVDAGAISVNNNSLEKQSNNSYFKFATIGQTPDDLGMNNTSNWSVAGANGITGFTYNDNATFPVYSGELPSKITRSAGVNIDISAFTSNADSVYVLIAVGDQSVLKHYAANTRTANITAADLSSLPAVTDNTAIVEVDPFRYTVQTINGKKYAFIKEFAKVAYVNID